MPTIGLDSYQPSPPGFTLGEWRASDHPGSINNGIAMARGEGHRLVIGSPGSGKFTSIIAPLLLTADDASAVVFDVANGEAVKTTASHRSRLGQIIVLDPFGISGRGSGALNPLDLLAADSPYLLERANLLARAIFIPSGTKGEDSYYDDQARDALAALLIHVAVDPSEDGSRTLKRVREIIRKPWSNDLLRAMVKNNAAGGVVKDLALNLAAAAEAGAEKNNFYVQQTLRANTGFLDLPTIQEVTSRTTLQPASLRERIGTLYVVIPEHQLEVVGRWLRLVYAVVMEEMRKSEQAGRVPLHVILDEFPSLGSFTRVAEDMARVRKFGVHMHVIAQSLAQLHKLYGDGWEIFAASAKFQQLLATNDLFTADYFSKRMGTTTRKTTSVNESRGVNNSGSSRSVTTSTETVPLMPPDEIGRLHRDFTLCLVEGESPYRLRKWHYYDDQFLMGRADKPKLSAG